MSRSSAPIQPSAAVVLTFGKHRGKPLAEVPKDYLKWALRTWTNQPYLRRAIFDFLTGRDVQFPVRPAAPASPSARVLDAAWPDWERRLANEYRAARGGLN